MNTVSDAWMDEWLRLNWDATPQTIEYAYGLGLIGLRQYLDATRADFLCELDELIVATVARTLTLEYALHLISLQEAA